VIAGLVAVISGSGGAAQDKPVWFWFATCGGPLMTIEVSLDGAVVNRASLPVCKALRGSAAAQGAAGRLDFTFVARRPMTWSGYRDRPDVTPAGERIEGSIWQAGAEPDTLLLGVSYLTKDRVLMNTIHTAHPLDRRESEIAKGLVVRTYPTIR
jgi:hypothetical protein